MKSIRDIIKDLHYHLFGSNNKRFSIEFVLGS